MAYQSMFASNAQAASSNKKGVVQTNPKAKGYQSMFGFNTAGLGEQSAQISKQADADRKRKQQQDQQAQQQQQQKKQQGSLFNKVKTVVKDDFVKPIVETGKKSVNTVTAGVAGSVGLATAGAQRVAGNKTGAMRTLNATQQEIDQQLQGKGVAGKGSYLTTKQAQKGGTALLKPGAQAVTDIAPLVVPVGKAAKGASLLAKVGRGAIENAAVGGVTTTANEALNGQLRKDKGGQILKSAATGAVIGAAVPLLHGGIKAGKDTVVEKSPVSKTKDAKALIQNTKTQSLLDKGRNAKEVDLPHEAPKPGTVIHPNGEAIALTPHGENTSKALHTVMDKVHQPTAAAPLEHTATGLPHEAAAATQPQVLPSAVSSTHITDEHPAVQAIQEHMADNYKPSTGHPDETFAAEHLQNNTAKALKTYQDRTEKVFGSKNIVGGDDAKYAVPNMEANKSVNYHEPASQFAKGYYKHLLTDPETTHKPVMITAGGTGAGKTSALKKYFVENGGNANDYAAIVDTNLTNLSSATSRIEPALATGHAVHVKFVYRDPVEAFDNGVIPRAVKEGRAVEAGTHADTHAGSLDAIKQIAEKYKDNPKVHIEIIDNSRGSGNSKVVTLDFLHDKSYTKDEIEKKIHDLLDAKLQKGELTNEQHTIFKGKDEPIAKPARTTAAKTDAVGKTGHDNGGVEQPRVTENGGKPEQERQSGRVAALKEEAKKYESADEFIKAQGELHYHGTNTKFDDFDPALSNSSSQTGVAKGHMFFTDDKGVARSYGKNIVPAMVNIRKPLVVDADGMPWDEINFRSSGYNQTINNIAKTAQEEGYDGLVVKNVRDTGPNAEMGGFKTSTATVAFDKEQIVTKQQLTDIYNEAHAEVKAPESARPAPKPEAKPEKIALKPHETAHMETIGGYTHSSHMEQDYADMLREQESSLKGGQLIKHEDGTAERISEHSRFYRDFYKENKKAPTKADWLEEAQRQLASGKDAMGAGQDYKALLEREGRPIPRLKTEPAQTKVPGPQVTPMVAKRIARDIKESYGDLSTVDKVSIEDQTNKAVKLISNREDLDAVIAGTKPLPDGLRATSIITAIRHDPVLSKDAELLLKVANSPLSHEASLSAQELRLAKENAKDDPVFAIKKLSEARKQAFEAKSKQTAGKAVQSEVQAIRQATPKVTKETFASFVESLKC